MPHRCQQRIHCNSSHAPHSGAQFRYGDDQCALPKLTDILQPQPVFRRRFLKHRLLATEIPPLFSYGVFSVGYDEHNGYSRCFQQQQITSSSMITLVIHGANLMATRCIHLQGLAYSPCPNAPINHPRTAISAAASLPPSPGINTKSCARIRRFAQPSRSSSSPSSVAASEGGTATTSHS